MSTKKKKFQSFNKSFDQSIDQSIYQSIDQTNNKEQLDITKINKDYIPSIFKLPSSDDNIFKYPNIIIFSTNIDYPRFSYGFQHFYHQSKDKLEITKEFEGKKKVYHVFNKFERFVDNYDLDINNFSKKYFGMDILSRSFFKLWEILFMFNIIPLNKSNFTSAHFGGPGSFIQATMYFRDKFIMKGYTTKNDKYYALIPQLENIQKYILPFDDNFIKHYEKEKPKRIYIIEKINDINNKIDLITSDSGFNWPNRSLQEQDAFILIFYQILMALNIQEKNGHFVCKIFETFTKTTVKLLYILGTFYKDIYIVKPLMSRNYNSEKYLVCLNFLYGETKKKIKYIKILQDMFSNILNNTTTNVVDLFPDFQIPHDYIKTIIKLNTVLANKQFISINEIVDFIQKQNYLGEVYQTKRQMQIDATKYWIKQYFPEINNFKERQKELQNLTNQIVLNNNNIINSLKIELI